MSNKDTPRIEPSLRFPKFLNAGSWKIKPLKEICEILNNRRQPISSSDRIKGQYPYYGASGVVDFVHNYIFNERLVLVGEDGAKWGAFEKTAFIAEGKYWVNNHAHVLRPTKIIDTLLENYLVMLDMRAFITGAAPPKLTLNKLKEIPIPLPLEQSEQQKIADCLSSIDELIKTESKKLDVLKTYKKALMQQLFPAEGETLPKLRFSRFQNAANWEIKSLGSLAENLDSKRIPITEQDRIKGHIPYYGASGVIDYINDYIFDDDLLCISEDGANLIARTYPIAFAINGKTWVNNHVHVLKFKNSFTQFIVKEYLNNISLEDYLTGMAQPKLNRAKLDIIPIPLPTVEEQELLAKSLISISDLMSEQNKKVDALRNHKKGLMQQLFPTISEL